MAFGPQAKPRVYVYFLQMRKQLEVYNHKRQDKQIHKIITLLRMLEAETEDKEWRFSKYLELKKNGKQW